MRVRTVTRGEGVGSLTLLTHPSSFGSVPLLSSRVRSDGKSASLTAPSGKAQDRLLGETLAIAAAGPSGLVEAHGTGTPLGDPTEMGGMESALTNAAPCPGSAKANLGHTEPVAGLLGLLALTRSAVQKASAPNANLRILNPMLAPRLRKMQGRLSTQTTDVVVKPAGVSSFGYSGTISHAIIAGVAPPPPQGQSARFIRNSSTCGKLSAGVKSRILSYRCFKHLRSRVQKP